jgi:hypothetical protein
MRPGLRRSDRGPQGDRSRSEPVQESGRRLASFPRQGGEELRISLDCYRGHPFVNVHKWGKGPGGRMFPLKGQGTTVRLSEIEGTIAALREARRLIERGEPLPEWERARPAAGGHVTPAMVQDEPAAIAVFATPPWDTPGDEGSTAPEGAAMASPPSAADKPDGPPPREFGAGLW